MNKTELEAKIKEALNMNAKTIQGCYATVGKLMISRDCTEEEAKQKIESQKQLVSYFEGYGKGIEFLAFYVDQLTVADKETGARKE